MMNDDERRRYADTTILETITEQQDDEIISSPMSQNSSVDRNHFLDEDQQRERDREEIENFEALEKEFASNRHGVRVTFAHSVDNKEDLIPMKQTTVVKTEPCFQIQSREDQITKHFYENSFPKPSSSSKTPSEHDSLEDEIDKDKLNKNYHFEPVSSLSSPSTSSIISPTKSILKKSSKHEDSLNKTRSRSPSPASKKKLIQSNVLSSNEFPYLAELTAKQTKFSSTYPPRSLFEPTMNIFDGSISSCPANNVRRRPSRLRYYIKPYRGEANLPPEKTSKHRSRSLSEQRMNQQNEPTTSNRWETFAHRHGRPVGIISNRKQHVSWSPVREYIHRGREKQPNKFAEKNEDLTKQNLSLSSFRTSTLSSSNPCLPNSTTSPSMIPISVRYRSTRVTTVPQHFSQSFPPVVSMDSYETCSVPDPSLTPITPLSQLSQYDEKEIQRGKHSPLPDVVYQHSKEHDETMQRYDRLLEKMRTTDEQLQQLTRSWNHQTSTKSTPVTHSTSTIPSSSSSSNNESFLSPSFLQMCLIILVILNLIILYFFNDINYWWSRYVNYAAILQHHERSTTHIS